jgi:hypothetical protein
MPSQTRTCVALLAALAVLPAARAAQTCTQKFSDLKTCTLFNGQFASGTATSLEMTMIIDGQLIAGYDNYKEIRKNDECKAMYLLVGCIGAVSHPDFPAAAPCSSTGAPLKVCKDLCVRYFKTCTIAAKTDAEIDKACVEMSAPAGNKCFGDAGVLGMKAAPKSDAHASIPPTFAVVFLAIAAWLAM